MTLFTIAWITLAAGLLVLALRMTLAETVWAGGRFARRPRRVLRGLDVLTVLLVLGVVAALVGVLAPAIIRS